MYPRNAASPERIAVGQVVLIADGTIQTSAVVITVRGQGGAEATGGGTTAYGAEGTVYYTPTQAETNYTSFVVIASKASCFSASQTIITTASATAGKVVLSGETHTSAVIPTVSTVTDGAKASVATEARLSELDAGTAGKMANQVDIIQTDTTTDIPALIATAQADLDTITGTDGVTLATAQALYAPAKAGDNMGAVTSVTGNVGGNVVGSVASVTANVNAVLTNGAHGGAAATLQLGGAGGITSNITGNLSGSVGSVTGTVGSVTGSVGSVTGAVGSVTGNVGGNVVGSVASVTDKAGFALSSTGLDLIPFNSTFLVASAKATWTDTLTTYTDGMAGKRLKGLSVIPSIEGTVNDAAATTTSFATTLTGYGDTFFEDSLLLVEIAADQWQPKPIATYTSATGVFTFDEPFISAPANGVNVAVQSTHIHTVSSIVAAIVADAVIAELTTQGDTNETKIDAILADTGTDGVVLTAAERIAIADALLDRNMATGVDSGSATVRTVRQALRSNRNKVSISGGTMTVTKEDDTTASWTAAVTTTAGNPISAIDPADA